MMPGYPPGSESWDSDESTESGLLDGIRDGAWLDAQDFPPLAYAVPGLVPEGFSLLVGAPKIGKSWLVLNLALAAAAGGVALGGIPVDARPVLYLALEDGERRLQDRCRVLLPGEAIPAGLHYLTRVVDGRAIDTIAAWFTDHGRGLVILDTLGKVMPPALLGESGYQRDYRIGGALKALVDAHPGATLLVNHHDRKAHAEDFVDSVSGTHGLAGAADTVLVLQRPRTETAGLLKVTGRDVPEAEYAITLDGGAAWRIDGTTLGAAAQVAAERRATAGLSDRSADIVAAVNAHPDGIDTAGIAAACDLDSPTAGAYLRRLAKADRITRAARGLYTPVRSVRVFVSEGDDAPGNEQTNTTNTHIAGPEGAAAQPAARAGACPDCGAEVWLIGDRAICPACRSKS